DGQFAMSEKFGGARHYPTIWILDPKGTIKLQFDGGADDHALYGALCDLRKGGSGNAKPRALPGERSLGFDVSFAGLGLGALLIGLAYLFALFYHPMAFLMTVVFTNGTLPFNYVAAFASIGRTHKDYVKTVGVLIAAVIAGHTLSYFMNDVLLLQFPEIVRDMGAGV